MAGMHLRKRKYQLWLPPETNKLWGPKRCQQFPFDSIDHEFSGQHEAFDEVVSKGFLSVSGKSKGVPILNYFQWDLESSVKYKFCIHQSMNYEVGKSMLKLVYCSNLRIWSLILPWNFTKYLCCLYTIFLSYFWELSTPGINFGARTALSFHVIKHHPEGQVHKVQLSLHSYRFHLQINDFYVATPLQWHLTELRVNNFSW